MNLNHIIITWCHIEQEEQRYYYFIYWWYVNRASLGFSRLAMKCRYCNSNEELKWLEPYVKGNRPVRAIDGKAHVCKNDKPQENMGTSVKERYDPNKFYCGVHRLELNDMVCRRCPKIQIAVRGSELN